ncbi:hypothetical protein PCASD_18953 [Puccinia coronata f. sp. avenae]|uniref:Uncharacterized protein n=1 Tax=Puccinia coronata f. sp. avenae TaxID=200324 RepID=A0A2N5S7Z2_9BASI|nr:hypothetical protein PCASD_18953 [Puccinia coronata f. sp. avenae]
MNANRAKETPFQRRERLNLEKAIALSTTTTTNSNSNSNSTEELTTRKKHSPHFIPNSQSDEDIIQDFTLDAAHSKPSPPTTAILPVHTSSMARRLADADSRIAGWSPDKSHEGIYSATDPSTRLKPKPLVSSSSSSSSSSKQSPKPPILEALSSASTRDSSPANRPRPRPPRPGAAAVQQARERLKLAESYDSLLNSTSSTTPDQSLVEHPFHPARTKSKPPEVLKQPQAKSPTEHTPLLDVEIIQIPKPVPTSSHTRPTLPQPLKETPIHPNPDPPIPPEPPEPQPFKKKRKAKIQEPVEGSGVPPEGSERPIEAQPDGTGKRVRKQSAVGKASAKSLQILLNLSQSSNENADASPKPNKDPIITGDSQKNQRRRGWVLATDEDPDPEPRQAPDITRREVPVPEPIDHSAGGSAHPSPNKNVTTPQAPVDHQTSSHPFLEIASSPLTSPSGFLADELTLKASKRSKPSPVPKKRPPKKKAAPKAKAATKNRKDVTPNPPAEKDVNGSVVSVEEHPQVDPAVNKTHSNARRRQDHPSPRARLQVPEDTHKAASHSPRQARTRPSPRRNADQEHTAFSNQARGTIETDPAINQPCSPSTSRNAGPSAAGLAQTGSAKPAKTTTATTTSETEGKAKNGKKGNGQVKKGMSLAEILAMTNPKTKRGIRIGLPREEKHRLHLHINPNPPVQKQVKKKLRVKRGEYDSGEDDLPANNGSSASESGQDGRQARGKETSTMKQPQVDEQDDDDDDNDDQDASEVVADEEY